VELENGQCYQRSAGFTDVEATDLNLGLGKKCKPLLPLLNEEIFEYLIFINGPLEYITTRKGV